MSKGFMFRSVALFCGLVLALCLAGCAGLVRSGPDVVVDVTNAFSFVQVGNAPITLKATTTNDNSNKGVKWALVNADLSCASACGTLVAQGSPSFSAVYTPPPKAPLNQQATIIASAVSEKTQQFAFTFTIFPPASIKIDNPFSSIVIGSNALTLNATVTNDPSNSGASWTLTAGGSNCSPSACGTLSPGTSNVSVVYTPPATFPTGANVNPTITAISAANSSATDSFNFAILNNTSLFKGNYAFLLRGYYNFDPTAPPSSAAQVPMAFAGTFTADGNGNLTNIEFDVNNSGGLTAITTPQTGTYTVNVGPTGIIEAVVTITSFKFGSGANPSFRCIMSADGTHGRMVELDQGAFLDSGVVELQDPAVLATTPAGNYAFGVDSDSPFGGRTIAAGHLSLGAAGVTGGVIDQSFQANLTPTFVAQPLSPDALSSPDAVGRGTLTITAQGQSVHYAYYIVDAKHFLLIEIDKGTVFGTVFGGVARSQNLSAINVNGVSVIQLTGFDVDPFQTPNPVYPVVIIGLLTVSGGNSFSAHFDINDIGQFLVGEGANGTVTFDPATGRAALSSPDGFTTNFLNAGAWYLYDTGKGFFVEEDISTSGQPGPSSITNRALSGTTLPQSGAPFQLSTVSGNVVAGFGASSTPLVPNVALGMNFVPPTAVGTGKAGSYTSVGDVTSIATQGGKIPDAPYSGRIAFVDSTNLANGHGLITLPGPLVGDFSNSGATYQATFYLIAPNQFVAIAGIPGSSFGSVPPFTGVIFVGP
jgi:hypothetical protein